MVCSDIRNHFVGSASDHGANNTDRLAALNERGNGCKRALFLIAHEICVQGICE